MLKAYAVIFLILFFLFPDRAISGAIFRINNSLAYSSNVSEGVTNFSSTAYGWSLPGGLDVTIKLGKRLVVGFGPMGMFNLSGTRKIKYAPAGVELNNFYISPYGMSGEVMFGIPRFFIYSGYGFYRATARLVVGTKGYDYQLHGGRGFHVGISCVVKRTGKGSRHLAGLTVDVHYISIRYDRREIGDLTYDNPAKWKQNMIGIGIGWALGT